MNKKTKTVLKWTLIICLIVAVAIVIFGFLTYFFYQTHYLPGTIIDNQVVSNLDQPQALEKISAKQINPEQTILLSYSPLQVEIASSASQLGLHYDLVGTTTQILQSQEVSFSNLWSRLVNGHQDLTLTSLQFDQNNLDDFLQQASLAINQTGTPAAFLLTQSGNAESLQIENGFDELKLGKESTLSKLIEDWNHQHWRTEALVNITQYQLGEVTLEVMLSELKELVGKNISFESGQVDNPRSLTLNDINIISLLGPVSATKQATWQDFVDRLESQVNRPTTEPQLEIVDGQVVNFVPPVNGLALDRDVLDNYLKPECTLLTNNNQCPLFALATASATVSLPVTIATPHNNLAGTNDLGISEQIGFGESYYAGSIPGRVHNVAVAASRINNFLVAPGEEFSFNKALGDVSAATGYQPGYIIQGGRSVLSDGGGVCQVSTTLFRALLDAGVQITKRKQHSYRVSYYELDNMPGFDATVYSGDVDLRFINDTPGHILISMETDSKNLYMNVRLYGTTDGRHSEIVGYKQWDYRGPAATEYIEDASLAPGQRKQIDFAASGIKAQFENVVYNSDGSVRYHDTYYSNYQPWSAKFLVGPSE